MANIKSAQKSIRKIAKRAAHNRSRRSQLRTLAKNVTKAEEGEPRRQAAIRYVRYLDRAAKTGLVHRNYADRNKSRVSRYIFPAAATPAPASGDS